MVMCRNIKKSVNIFNIIVICYSMIFNLMIGFKIYVFAGFVGINLCIASTLFLFMIIDIIMIMFHIVKVLIKKVHYNNIIFVQWLFMILVNFVFLLVWIENYFGRL